MPDSRGIAVSVVFARAEAYWSLPLQVPPDATVSDALAMAAADSRFGKAWAETAGLAIFGRLVTADTRLHDGDRIELLRGLLADPKQARRERASPPKRRS